LKNCHPASGFRARGKRRGFSPGAAARHSQYARVYAEFVQNTLFFIFSSSAWGGVAELEKKSWVQPAEPKRNMGKIGPKFGGRKMGSAG